MQFTTEQEAIDAVFETLSTQPCSEQAMSILNAAVHAYPKSAPIAYYMGVAAEQAGQGFDARRNLLRAIACEPRFAPAYIAYAASVIRGNIVAEYSVIETILPRIYHQPTLDGQSPVAKIRDTVDVRIAVFLSIVFLVRGAWSDALPYLEHAYTLVQMLLLTSIEQLLLFKEVCFQYANALSYTDMHFAARVAWDGLTRNSMEIGSVEDIHIVEHPAWKEIQEKLTRSFIIQNQYESQQYPWISYARELYQRANIVPISTYASPWSLLSQRRIRIGYLCHNWNRNAISLFTTSLLTHASRDTFEIFCYYTCAQSDVVTEFQRSHLEPHHWFDVSSQQCTDESLEALLFSQELDLLIDLDSWALQSRSSVVWSRPARKVLSYLGFPGFTHLPEVYDYFLTDERVNPPHSLPEEIREPPLYLPRSFLCFQPFPMFPVPSIAYAAPRERVVLGVLNKTAKHSSQFRVTLLRLVQRYPYVQILYKQNKNESPSPLYDDFPPNTVQTRPFAEEWKDYVTLFDEVDLCVDTFPYSGTATTCMSLWRGCPPYCMRFPLRHVNNVSSSLLEHLGWDNEYVATSVGDLEYRLSKAIECIWTSKQSDWHAHCIQQQQERVQCSNTFLEYMDPRKFMSAYEQVLRNVAQES